MVIKNTCTPQRIYGPYTQTLFLGLTVQDFSCSVGWNEQFTTCTVNLVKDPCPGYRKVLNHATLSLQEIEFVEGDPGFIFDDQVGVGTPVFFKVENFEFAGIIQSYIYQESSNGFTYAVTLISPGVILESAQLILDKYAGPIQLEDDTAPMSNIYNVYGFLESLGEDCGLLIGDITFGSLAGGFGNALRTDRGIPWTLVKKAVQVLTGGLTTNNPYSPYSALLAKAGTGQYGSIKNKNFILDISEVPLETDINSGSDYKNYRIGADNLSILELLSTVCRDAGYEFYVDLLPTRDDGAIVNSASDDRITNVIKIRTIERRNQPALGAISDFIQSQNENGKVVSQDSLGVEYATENNSAFLVGGQKRQVYQQTSQSFIEPYWGKDDEGELNYGDYNGLFANQWGVRLDVRSLNLSLNTVIPSNYVNVPETCLLMAQADIESFKNWICNIAYGTDLGIYITSILGINPSIRLNTNIGTIGQGPPLDSFFIGGIAALSPVDPNILDLQTVYNWLNSYATSIYGRQWLVKIPWVCFDTDTDTLQAIYSDVPSTEGGWPNTTVLGLAVQSTYLDFFSDEQGKVQPILRFSSDANIEGMSSDNFVSNGTSVWTKATISDRWIIKDGSAWALLDAGSAVLQKRDKISENYMILLGTNFRQNSPPGNTSNANKSPDKSDAVGAAGLPMAIPVGAAVPVLSNTQTYGPWSAIASVDGKVYYENEDGLVPWEYGGFYYMNLAAEAKINNSICNIETVERGSVTVAGYPERSLGSDISDSPISAFDRSNLLLLGSYQSAFDTFNFKYLDLDGPQINKGAQITNISVNVGNEITTQYNLSSFTPTFGRFSKGNADRLKQIGQQRYRTAQKIRALSKLDARLNLASNMAYISKVRGFFNGSDAHRSSAIMLLGKKFGNRKSVNIPTASMLTFYDDYDNSAMMSLDGLVSPVQKRTAATSFAKEVLPGTPTTNNQPNYTESPPPPLNEYAPKVVNTYYLDFLANPNDPLQTNKSNVAGSGHNIEAVARGQKTDIGTGYITIPAAENAGGFGYENDYRYLALRGPLMLHGWGYDIMGKPVPNSDGDTSTQPDTSYDNKTDKFKDGWLQDDTLWPVAPVDLRYDRKRGVWTTPPDFRLLLVTGNPIAAGSTASIDVKNADDVFGADGSVLASKTISLHNITDVATPSGTEFLAYYSNYFDEYWPIFPGSAGSGLKIKDTAGACDPNAIVTTYSDVYKLNFGNGLVLESGTSGEYTVYSTYQVNVDGDHYSGIKLSGTLSVFDTEEQCVVTIYGQPLRITDTGGACDLTSVIAGTQDAYRLIFGSGLHVTDQTLGAYRIDALHHATISGKNYSNILLDGTLFGILEDQNNQCQITLSGKPLQIKDTTGLCDINAIITDFTDTYRINFGSGLYVAGADGEYIVHTLHHTTISGTGYSNILLTGNLVGMTDECTITISGKPLQITDSLGRCDIQNGLGNSAYVDTYKIDFASGLYVTGADGNYTVHALHHATISGINYSNILLDGNLVGIPGSNPDDCTITISGIPAANIIYITDTISTCENPTVINQALSHLYVGSGLSVISYSGGYAINSLGLINIDSQYSTGIKLTGNLSSTHSNCLTTISGAYLQIKDTSGICNIAPTITNYTDAYKLDFGDGLLVFGSNGEYTISAASKINVDSTIYSKIKFVGNLSQTVEDSCTVIISGNSPVLPKIIDTVTQCHTPTITTAQDFSQLQFGSGLSVISDGANVYSIHSIGLINIDGQYATGVTLAGNLSASTNACNVTISGTKLKIYDTAAACDTAATITGLTDADQIIFGNGLRLEGSAGIYTVHSEENVTVGGSVYSNIQVAGNLSAIPTGCDVIISGSEFRLKFSDTVSTCHTPTLSDITDAEHIYIGSGLSFTYEGANVYQIHSLGLVNIDGSPYTGIKLAGNLTAISDGCTVTISGDTGISSGISVVCDVDCSGNNFIVASTRTLTFNDGLLTNGGTCASEISASEVRWSAVAGWVSNLVSNTTLPDGVSHFVTAATAAGDILITLATTASQMLYQTIITKTTAANEVIISGQAGALINGASTYTLTHLYETVKLNTDGTNYYIV